MAEYPIIMKQKNDQGQYDTLYPQTLGSQIQGNIQSSQIEGDIPSRQISGSIPSSQITGQFPASQIDGIYTADETLTDAVASVFGFGASAVPNDMFNVLTHAGDLHVWKRTIDGVTDYPVHPNRNAYQEGSDAKPAGYTLGEVQNGKFYFTTQSTVTSGTSVSYYYSSSISVDNDGNISMPSGSSMQGVNRYNSDTSSASVFKGKFIQAHTASSYSLYGSFKQNVIYYIPPSATITLDTSSYAIYVNQYQPVTGYPAIPAGTIIEYIGQVGDKTGVKTGEYTGTGSYGSANATSLTFDRIPSLLIVQSLSNDDYGMTAIIIPKSLSGIMLYNQSGGNVNPLVIVSHGPTVSWYSAVNATIQMNYKYDKYCYTAFL